MATWTIIKALHGILEGITVTDTLTQDASFGAPFKAGQLVKSCAGSDYTVIGCTR